MKELTNLIQTKLHPPPVGADLVERPSLFQRLQQNPDRSFTLVSAPAGYGKTTLIAAWLSRQSAPYAWLSLDQFDDDPAVFLRYVAGAIRGVFPEACAGLTRVLQAPDLPAAGTLAAIVINDLSQLPQPLVLALDDYHLLRNRTILQLVERILEQAPNRLHLVIISRMDPLLPLPRWRTQPGMLEIRQEDLRFSDAEAAQFLQTTAVAPIAPEIVPRLNQQLEGWVAGLRLLALSLQDSESAPIVSPEFQAGAREYITHYLFTEVLAQQTPDVQQFLLKTAVTDRFCADLADVLSPEQAAARQIIAYLKRADLFIIPLDEAGEWFRYHHLFQQMLQQKAAAQFDKAMLVRLHNLAGDWLAQHGFVDEALQHYLDAGTSTSLNAGVALIESNSRNLLNSLERRRLERWLEILPPEIVWQRPRLLLAKAWLHYRHWQLQAMTAVLNQLQTWLQNHPDDLPRDEKDFVLGQWYTLHCVTTYCLDADFAGTISAADEALRLLPPTEQGTLGTAVSYRAASLQATGEGETAVAQLQQALADPAPQGPAWVQLYLGLSFAHLTAGSLLALHRVVEQFLATATVNPMGTTPANWVSGIALYEANQLDAARQAFTATVELHYSTNFLAACDSWLGLARICQEQGDLAQAQHYLETARAEALRLGSADLLPVIEAVQAYQAHLQGETLALSNAEVAVALRWISAFQPDAAPEYAMLTFIPLLFWARLVAALGDEAACESARHVLEAKLETARTSHHVRRQIQLLAHLALLEIRLGEQEAARQTLQTAVKLAQPGGFVRSFVDCGLALRPLFQYLQQQAIAPHYVAQLLAAYPSTNSQEPEPPPLETILTAREAEILRLMQAGYSNTEIAQTLVISLYTVKRHASNIYRKLGVNGRRQAVYKAEQAGILTPA